MFKNVQTTIILTSFKNWLHSVASFDGDKVGNFPRLIVKSIPTVNPVVCEII